MASDANSLIIIFTLFGLIILACRKYILMVLKIVIKAISVEVVSPALVLSDISQYFLFLKIYLLAFKTLSYLLLKQGNCRLVAVLQPQ